MKILNPKHDKFNLYCNDIINNMNIYIWIYNNMNILKRLRKIEKRE